LAFSGEEQAGKDNRLKLKWLLIRHHCQMTQNRIHSLLVELCVFVGQKHFSFFVQGHQPILEEDHLQLQKLLRALVEDRMGLELVELAQISLVQPLAWVQVASYLVSLPWPWQ